MARGGFRPGAGRPKSAKSKTEIGAPPPDVKKAARKAGMTPLDYMLRVMNDDDADNGRRDRMAIAAAPFVHGRAADLAKPGTKEQAQAAAATAAAGTEWDGLLTTPAAPLQ